jgi:hypothetical protein
LSLAEVLYHSAAQNASFFCWEDTPLQNASLIAVVLCRDLIGANWLEDRYPKILRG